MESEADTRTGLLLKYSIEERVYKDQPLARVHFYKDAVLQPSQVQRSINLRPEDMGKHQCTREVAYLRVSFYIPLPQVIDISLYTEALLVEVVPALCSQWL